ncbi:transposase [Micromonospora sp. WMMC415]|nr:transposase [Micromonospora sp. WMMC415]
MSDIEWEALSRYLPSAVTGGRPRIDDRRVLNGTVWKFRAVERMLAGSGPMRTRLGTSTGCSRSTRPLCGPTSTPRPAAGTVTCTRNHRWRGHRIPTITGWAARRRGHPQ